MQANDITISRITTIYETTIKTWAMPRFLYRTNNAFIFFVDGCIDYCIGSQWQSAGPGDVLIFPQGLYYRGEKRTASQHYIVINFDTAQPDELSRLELPYIFHGNEFFQHLFEKCVSAWRSDNLYAAVTCRAYCYEILSQLIYACYHAARTQHRLQDLLHYIHHHYTSHEMTVLALSQQAHMSTSQLRRVFQQEVGESPSQYILHLRLELAKSLLRDEGLPVGEVAVRCGFASEYYFSRFFKQQTGIAPSLFR